MKTVLGGAFFVGISFLLICSFPVMPYGASQNNPEQLQSFKPPSLQAPKGLGGCFFLFLFHLLYTRWYY